jgi:hypothetical protein
MNINQNGPQDGGHTLNAIREQRDELLEALKLVERRRTRRCDGSNWSHWAISEKTIKIVKEAIRKAGGAS